MIVGSTRLATYLAKKRKIIYVSFLIVDEVHKNLGALEKANSTQIGVMLKMYLRAFKVIGLSGIFLFVCFLFANASRLLQLSQL